MPLSYDSNADLAFDTDVFRKCGEEYAIIANRLNTMAENLDKAILELKDSGWTTPAGSAFYALTETNWKNNIKQYADLLINLNEILQDAAKKYDDLVKGCIEKINI